MQEFAFGFITRFIILAVLIPYLLIHAPDNQKKGDHIHYHPVPRIAFILSILTLQQLHFFQCFLSHSNLIN